MGCEIMQISVEWVGGCCGPCNVFVMNFQQDNDFFDTSITESHVKIYSVNSVEEIPSIVLHVLLCMYTQVKIVCECYLTS